MELFPTGLDESSFNFLMGLAGLLSAGLFWKAILDAYLN